MILIRTCWYLCVMFLIMLGCASLATVAPGGEAAIAAAMLGSLILSIVCSGAAVLLGRQFKRRPDSAAFKSRIVSGIFVGIAALLTLFVLFGILA
jgi:hypothetical protein